MSEINCYGTEEVYGEVVPGWHLVRLVNVRTDRRYYISGTPGEGPYMEEGSYGLTRSNDPDFVFNLPPSAPPQTNHIPEITEEDTEYYIVLDHYQDRLYGDAITCYELVKASIEAGYDPTEGGFASWIMEQMFLTWLSTAGMPLRSH